MQRASEQLAINVKAVYNISGDCVSTIDVIRDGDTIICASDEPYIPGKYHASNMHTLYIGSPSV